MNKLFEARAAVLEYEAKQRLIEKEIELEKLKQQSKPWVGLTDEDKLAIRKMPWEFIGDLIVNTEAKLREKNGGAV